MTLIDCVWNGVEASATLLFIFSLGATVLNDTCFVSKSSIGPTDNLTHTISYLSFVFYSCRRRICWN